MIKKLCVELIYQNLYLIIQIDSVYWIKNSSYFIYKKFYMKFPH